MFSLISRPELTRRRPNKGFKRPGKIALVIIPDLKANLGAILVGRQQQLLGSFHTNACEVIYQGNAHLLFK